MTGRPVILRAAPPMGGKVSPGTDVHSKALASRLGLYVFAAGEAGADADHFGLGGALVARGTGIAHAALIVPDDLGERDPVALAAIRKWARAHRFDTLSGPQPWRVVTLSELTDPKATVEDVEVEDGHPRPGAPWAFQPRAYSGAGPVIGADIGRTLALLSDPAHTVKRNGANKGKWELWLPLWGKRHADGDNVAVTSRNRPPLRVESRRSGWQVDFGPVKKGFGKWVGKPGRQRAWQGYFIDVLSLADALDADKAGGFVEHARHAGVTVGELPVTVPVDASGAIRIAVALADIHKLALTLDNDAGRWFTTATERSEGVRRINLARSVSPAGLAAMIPTRFKVTPPLTKLHLSQGEHQRWFEAFYGNWCDGDERLWRVPFNAVAMDLSSAFPLVAHRVGWWELMTAEHIDRETVTSDLRQLCERAIEEPTVVLDPAVWRRFGLTLVECVPDGQPFPVSVDDPHRPDGRLVMAPLVARGRSAFYSWLDVVNASVRDRRVPEIVKATRLVPVGREAGLRQRFPVYPGLALDVGEDPVLGLVRRRRQAKLAGDDTLAAVLRVAVNALVFGNPARLDDHRRPVGNKKWKIAEKVGGAWHFMPVAATVQAGARLLLGVADRLVTDLGGTVAYRNTDSSIIPASPAGGTLALPDGTTVRQLSWAEVKHIRHTFDRLAPEPAWPVWKVERGTEDNPLRALVFGQMRHAEYVLEPDGPRLIDWTESGLGGNWSDPAGMTGRCAEGGRAWSKAAVLREIAYAEAKLADPAKAARQRPAWDVPGAPEFPTLRRLQVTSPTVLASLPEALGAQVGSRFIEGQVKNTLGGGVRSVVALDPGGDLDGWESLRWLDRASGALARVTTDPTYRTRSLDWLGPVLLETLSSRAEGFARPAQGERIELALVTPLSVRYRGRVAGVLDAVHDVEPEAVIRSRRPVYEDGYGFGPGQRDALLALAERMGAAEFARQAGCAYRTAQTLADGRLPSPASVRRILTAVREQGLETMTGRTCALVGCSRPLPKGARGYCSPEHSEVGRKRRQRAAKCVSNDPGREAHDRKATP